MNWINSTRRSIGVLVFLSVALLHTVPNLEAQQSFTFLQNGFSQQIFGTAPSFFGGVAFANGDVLVDACLFSGSPLFRFELASTILVNGTTVHPQAAGSPFLSNAGCGLTNHPDGSLYSNTSLGVINLDAGTGAQLRAPFGPPGNALGITVDPQTNRLVYVAQDCRFTATCTIVSVDPATTTSTTLAVLSSLDSQFVDGIFFDTTGNFLFLSNRSPVFRMTVLNRSGAVVQHVPMTSEPDGIAFHKAPQFVVTNNTDGTISRFDFPLDDFTMPPSQSVFASGGFRGDLSQVGGDGCLYATQNGTRFNDGTTSGSNSVVRICPNFSPPPGVKPPACPLTQGFWKNHPDVWPADFLKLGTQSYTKAELLDILTASPGADASLILARQLIAAKLNVLNGSNPAPISTTVTHADTLLSGFTGKLPYSVDPFSATGQPMVTDADVLDSYNSGQLTPNCQP